MSAEAWVRGGGSADPQAIRRHIAGNLCRCTGYQHIVKAISETVAKKRPRKGKR